MEGRGIFLASMLMAVNCNALAGRVRASFVRSQPTQPLRKSGLEQFDL